MIPKWKECLKKELASANRIAVLGAGSVLCGDDAVGMIVAELLEVQGRDNPQLLAIQGSTAPENFCGVIRDFEPDLLLLVDAAHIKGEVGDISFIEPEDIESTSLSTHMLPFGVLLDYLGASIANCRMKIIGIKPGNIDFGTDPSKTIKRSAAELAKFILDNTK